MNIMIKELKQLLPTCIYVGPPYRPYREDYRGSF